MTKRAVRRVDGVAATYWTFCNTIDLGLLVQSLEPLLPRARGSVEFWRGPNRQRRRWPSVAKLATMIREGLINRAIAQVEVRSLASGSVFSGASAVVIEIEPSPDHAGWLDLSKAVPDSLRDSLLLSEANRPRITMAWNDLAAYPTNLEVRASFPMGQAVDMSAFLQGAVECADPLAEGLGVSGMLESVSGVSRGFFDRWGRGLAIGDLRGRFPASGLGWILPRPSGERIARDPSLRGVRLLSSRSGKAAVLVFPEGAVVEGEIRSGLAPYVLGDEGLRTRRSPSRKRGEYAMPDGTTVFSLGRLRELERLGPLLFLTPGSEARALVLPRFIHQLGWHEDEVPCAVWEAEEFKSFASEVERGLAGKSDSASVAEILRAHRTAIASHFGEDRAASVAGILAELSAS